MELDRQSIERRDFPIARRGYDPATVDAHLHALAAEVDELRWHSADSRAGESLGTAAAGHVKSILDAAEASAADIERQAAEDARRTRDEAARDAERTRAEMAQRTQAHVEAVARAAAVLLARVESMDGEVSALVHSLRAGAGRLAADLGSVEANVSELYDAVSGRAAGVPDDAPAHEPEPAPEPEWVEPIAGPGAEFERMTEPGVEPVTTEHVTEPGAESVAARVTEPVTEPIQPVGATPADFAAAPSDFAAPPIAASVEPAAPVAPPPHAVAAPGLGGGDPNVVWPAPAVAPPADEGRPAAIANNGDLDGARLVALNMALNGEAREQADRYLAENFQLADRAKLLDEVYAAIEG